MSRTQGRRPPPGKASSIKKVTLGYCHPDVVSAFWADSMLGIAGFSHRKIDGHISVWSSPKIDEARNSIVKTWLEVKDTDALFMTDTDMVMPPECLEKLISADKDIVGGLCFVADPGLNAVKPSIGVLKKVKGGTSVLPLWDYPENALVQVDAIGAACMLIKRKVAEDMWEARGKDFAMPWFAHGMHGDVVIGEDIAFCLTARAMGFEVWVDTSLTIFHVKPQFVGPAEYAISLSKDNHPFYDEREGVTTYRRIVHGDTSLDDS